MREMFPENFIQDQSYFDVLWSKAIIVFDTNVLMDFHAWPQEKFDWLINSIEPIAERFWLPNQVAREFTRNRTHRLKSRQTVIKDEIKNLQTSIDEVKTKILGQLGNARVDFDPNSFPDIKTQIQEWIDPIIEILEKERLDLNSRENLSNDDIFTKIESVFAGKIGDPFSYTEEMDIYEEGARRYAGLIPPGFGDIKDKPEWYRLYGDLILWKQIIKYASNINCPGIILVTNDRKNDWFENKKDPHRELLKEFRVLTHGKPFWMYSFSDFLYNAEKQNIFLSLDKYSEVIKEANRDARDRENTIRLAKEYGVERLQRELNFQRHLQENARMMSEDFKITFPSINTSIANSAVLDRAGIFSARMLDILRNIEDQKYSFPLEINPSLFLGEKDLNMTDISNDDGHTSDVESHPDGEEE